MVADFLSSTSDDLLEQVLFACCSTAVNLRYYLLTGSVALFGVSFGTYFGASAFLGDLVGLRKMLSEFSL